MSAFHAGALRVYWRKLLIVTGQYFCRECHGSDWARLLCPTLDRSSRQGLYNHKLERDVAGSVQSSRLILAQVLILPSPLHPLQHAVRLRKTLRMV
jgi:hypothetical protein